MNLMLILTPPWCHPCPTDLKGQTVPLFVTIYTLQQNWLKAKFCSTNPIFPLTHIITWWMLQLLGKNTPPPPSGPWGRVLGDLGAQLAWWPGQLFLLHWGTSHHDLLRSSGPCVLQGLRGDRDDWKPCLPSPQFPDTLSGLTLPAQVDPVPLPFPTS